MGAQAQQGGTSALRRGMQGSTANKGGSSPALQGHSMQKGIGGRAGPQGAHQLPYSSDRHHQLGGSSTVDVFIQLNNIQFIINFID